RDARDHARGRIVSDPEGHDSIARRAPAHASRWRAAGAGRVTMHRARRPRSTQGDGGAMRRGRVGATQCWNVPSAVVGAALLSIVPTFHLSAQVPDTTAPAVVTTGALVVPTDTAHRVRPMGAFLRSLVMPGWGQAVTGRKVTGALFTAWEGVTVMMTLKAQSE